MRTISETCFGQSLKRTDGIKSLPSSLENDRLQRAEVHYEGWYVEPTLDRVEVLAPAILDFLPKVLVGQEVMISDNQERHKGKT